MNVGNAGTAFLQMCLKSQREGAGEMLRWLRALVLARTLVRFPTATWKATTVPTPVPRDPVPSSDLSSGLHGHGTQTYLQSNYTLTHTIKKSERNPLCVGNIEKPLISTVSFTDI